MNNAVAIVVLEVIVVGCSIAFFHQRDPDGLNKVWTDFNVLVDDSIYQKGAGDTSATASGTPAPSGNLLQPATDTAPPAPAATTAIAPTPVKPITPSPAPVAPTPAPVAPTPAAAPSSPLAPAAPAPWTPPNPLPQQPNWTWTTVSGQVYYNVHVIAVDQTTVTITHQDGGQRVLLSDLPPDLQKLFNYTPSK